MSDTPTSQAWVFPPPPAPDPQPTPARSRRWGWVAGAIVVALALVAGLSAITLTRNEPAEAQPLALSFTPGQSRTYEVHQTMDGVVSSDLLGTTSVTMDLTQVFGWRVVSVDPEGVATIEVEVSEMSGTVNGTEIPVTPLPTIEIEVAPDGRIVSAGGLALGGADQTLGFGFPGMGQLTPVLPDAGEAVAVGDRWTKEFSQAFPFGEGEIAFTATSTYDRDEGVGGRDAAVIVTELTVPLDFTMEVAELIDALGDQAPALAGTKHLGALDRAEIAYGGTGEVTQTSWVDLEARELLRTQGRGDFDITLRFLHFPQSPTSAFEMAFTGTFTQELALR